MISLQLLFEAISQVKDEQDLRSQLVPKIGEYFAAKRSGIFFFDQLLGVGTASPLENRKFQKVLNVVLSIEHNPVARYIAERHTPVHEGLVTSPKAWAIICPRPDHWHVMAGPIIDRGQLIGSVGCTREKSMPAFDAQDIADLSAICLHLSVWIASVRFAPSTVKDPILEPQHQPLNTHRLTSRELEIANLVALGRTNTEIGTELWITENSVKQALKRMFRKLEVSSRTEMVAQLFATQHHFPSAKPSPSNLALNAHQ
ncbi:LuxR C-terminal-related transcriptional regulator [Coleofasciculus sp. FACHB-129]|uniref:LuxR C-terminal-related transcriptional regulator n=1 Tax=Cyanophyceae TaxID=3028117 RepID=UPI0016837BA3|nr:LuxR C-terminal-related transcriptional regulator [Coleofasciculus sp. FACHB-129]MBD1896536.1 LuxR family transcriptional regulator [Coleofasciculus sp. FACHB-129]